MVLSDFISLKRKLFVGRPKLGNNYGEKGLNEN
jgi:hypothetical protein